MGFWNIVFGGSFGLATTLIVRSLRNEPLMRAPWEHVISIGTGCAIGYIYSKSLNYEREKYLKELELWQQQEILRKRKAASSDQYEK